MYVYVAADSILRTIPWDEDSPAFYVDLIDGSEQANLLRRHFSKKHIYYLGSHLGCGCGFPYGKRASAAELRDETATRESVRRLREYLSEAVRGGPVELYPVWAGGEGSPPRSRRAVTPDYFGGEGFRLRLWHFLLVRQGDFPEPASSEGEAT